MIAQIFIANSRRLLTLPLMRDEAVQRINRNWLAYIGILLLSAGVMLVAVYDLVTRLNYSVVSVLTTIISFASNVLVLTLIGTDTIIASLHRMAERRHLDEQHRHLREESEAKLRQFCG
jgi:hypothetical protein